MYKSINIFKRNYRSGVGVNSYKNGGFIVDAPKNNLQSNEIIFKTSFPKEWKVILIFDSKAKGLHGSSEKKFFSTDTTLSKFSFNKMKNVIIKGEMKNDKWVTA